MSADTTPDSKVVGRTDADDFKDDEDLLGWFALGIVFVGLASVALLAWLFSNSQLLKSNFHFLTQIGPPLMVRAPF